MLKKVAFVLIILSISYARNIEYYFYNLDMNYKEYENGSFLDGESTDFGDMLGVGIKYSDIYKFKYFLKAEYAYGKTTYDGSTWAGDPLSLRRKNVYLLNFEGGIFPYNKYFYLSIGYRYWNRGKSDYSGDYNEKYYWKYLGIGYNYAIEFNKISIEPELEYQYTFNPKLDLDLGSGGTVNLGKTYGYKAGLKFNYEYSEKISYSMFYRYQYWHISKSDSINITLNNLVIPIYEPESKTRNQYVGIGVNLKF